MAKRKKNKKNRSSKGTRPLSHKNEAVPAAASTQPAPDPVPEVNVEAPAEESVDAVVLQPFGEGPRFTVLMAAYNRADLIGIAIDSVLVQDFNDYELVIVDDGSTDGTPQVVAAYSDPRIRYIRKEKNEGRSPTRNRAISEARGEFVLWMADDDLLAPGLLTLYDGILANEPHVDVIYGKLQLFDHDSGQDLNVFTPNDWTGRDEDVVGAKLYGSCVPDGGTATRRQIYAHVGPGPYDDEFVRAQDYELWTRIVGRASFRFVDEIVYRYRKHAGGNSWGEFIDLTLDSKIIRRHLARHPLKRLFLALDWQHEDVARNMAYLRIAKNLQLYGDHLNTLRFLDAIIGHNHWPEAIGCRVRSLLAMGNLDGAHALIEDMQNALGCRHRLQAELRSLHQRLSSFRSRSTGWLNDGQLDTLVQEAVTFDNSHFQSYDTMYNRGQAHLLAENHEAAIRCFCLAAHLNPYDTTALKALRTLQCQYGVTPRTDLDAMRRRLSERFVELTTDTQCSTTEGPVVSVVVTGPSGHSRDRAIQSVCRQSYSTLQILVAGGETSIRDTRIECPGEDDPMGHGALTSATGTYVAWIDEQTIWYPRFIAESVDILQSGVPAVTSYGHLVRTEGSGDDEQVVETQNLLEGAFSRSNCLGDDLLPLVHLVHRRPEEGDPQFRPGPHGRWDYALQWMSQDGYRYSARPGLCRPAPAQKPVSQESRFDWDEAWALLTHFAHFHNQTAFDFAARDAQNRRLLPLGYHQTRQGRSSIIIQGGRELGEIRACIEQVRACTRVPYELVVMVEPANEETSQQLNTWAADRHDFKVGQVMSSATESKQVNDGISRANGEFVAIIDVGSRVSAGWLGRLQWWSQQNRQWGVVHPTLDTRCPVPESDVRMHRKTAWGRSLPDTDFDGRCVLIHRRVLDRIGGMDVTLGAAGLEWRDYALRLKIAGFEAHRVSDVVMGASAQDKMPDGRSIARFEGRWGAVEPDVSHRPYNREEHFHAFGAEEGFRVDSRPVVVEEAGTRNILVMPPWDTQPLLDRLLTTLNEMPQPVSTWLRCPQGKGETYRSRLLESAERCGLTDEELPSILLVDAFLAPEREAGLYRAADAVFVEDEWQESALVIRRASDCGCRILRGRDLLESWLQSDG